METERIIRMLFVVSIAAIILLAAYFFLSNSGSDDQEEPNEGTVVDAVGRTVEIPESLENGIVTAGKLSVVRMLSYFPESFGNIVMVDLSVKQNLNTTGQNFVFVDEMKSVIEKAATHETDTFSDADKEAIGNLNPSLILVNKSTYSGNKDACDLLARNFTLIVVEDMGRFDYNRYWNDDLELDKDFTDCFTLMGKILGQEERAQELVDGMNKAMKDIKGMMSGEAKGSYYVTGVSYMGSNDLLATFPNYLPLMMVGGTNAYEEAKGSYDGIRVQLPDGDALSEFDFTDVILDPSSYGKLSNPNSQIFLKYVHTKNLGGAGIKIHTIYPMVAFGSNWENVIVNAYHLAGICYDTGLTKSDIDARCTDLMDLFFKGNGGTVLKGMEDMVSEFGRTAAGGQDLTIYADATVTVKSGVYYITKA